MKRSLLRSVFRSILLVAPFAVSSAWAGSVEHGEHIQLYEEMKKMAARTAWNGVETNYQRLLELEAKGEALTYDDHRLGAEAARAMGHMTACRERLQRAANLKQTEDVQSFIREIDQSFGTVDLKLDPKYQGPRILTPTVPPFAPDPRSNIAFVNGQLQQGKPYKGLLPLGEYTIGTTTFTVGAEPTSVTVLPPPNAAFEPMAGLRASVGISYLAAGEAEEAPVTGNFGGAGARLGIGADVALTKSLGVIALAGYHNFFADAGSAGTVIEDGDAPAMTYSKNTLHMGYGWLAGTFRAGDIRIAVGPTYGIGKVGVTDGVSTVPYEGFVKAGGATAGLSYGLAPMGKLQAAVALEGGLLTDTDRNWTWGEVAFVVQPDFGSSK